MLPSDFQHSSVFGQFYTSSLPFAFLNSQKDDGTEETLTSTEFDKFLAERAAAAENLPTVSTNQSGGGDSKKKDDKNVLIA